MWINKEIDDRLREYLITQLLNWLRFLLAVNEITNSEMVLFDEARCDAIRWDYPHLELMPTYRPNYKCLWDIIFGLLGRHRPFTPLFSAYCRSNNITTKPDLYIKMSAELKIWVDKIDQFDQFDDMVIIAIGMTKNMHIYDAFYKYVRIRNASYDKPRYIKFYQNALDVLKKYNFENIDPDSHEIQLYRHIQIKYDVPLQQVFCKHIILRLIYKIQTTYTFPLKSKYTCAILSNTIFNVFRIIIDIRDTDQNIDLDNMDQVIEYCESKIPHYPAIITEHLSIFMSINGYIYIDSDSLFYNLSKMAELSYYNLRDLPMVAILNGYCGATPLHKIQDIPEYYARITQSY